MSEVPTLLSFVSNSRLQAKKAGTKIEEIRSKISRHKEAIELIRKCQASTTVSNHEEERNDGNVSNEKLHFNAIDREKASYKETLEQVSVLKGTIESLQQKIEKGRLKMQSDFDIWYNRVVSFNEDQRGNIDELKQMIPKQGGNKAVPLHFDPPSPITAEEYQQQTNAPHQTNTNSQSHTEFKLPEGIELTGNAEADADIIAFYKAKEVLLSKLKRK